MESLGSPLPYVDGRYILRNPGDEADWNVHCDTSRHHRFVVQTDPNLSPSQGIFVRFEHVLYEHDDPGCR